MSNQKVKMNKVAKISFLAIGLSLSIFACKKETIVQEEGLAIEIITPTTNQYWNADSSRIAFNISNNDELHMVKAVILVGADTLYQFNKHVHSLTFSFDEKIKRPVVYDITNAILRVTAEDHNENTLEKEVAFIIYPDPI